MNLLEGVCAQGWEALQLQPEICRLSPKDLGTILHDFNLAKAKQLLTVSTKLDCWRRLPWQLCGLADSDERAASRIAAEILKKT